MAPTHTLPVWFGRNRCSLWRVPACNCSSWVNAVKKGGSFLRDPRRRTGRRHSSRRRTAVNDALWLPRSLRSWFPQNAMTAVL
jgi:hypothetical protein